jgi:hypothetical protein
MPLGLLAKRLAFYLLLSGVTVLSLLPGPYLPPLAFDVWDKAQHALAFAGLAGLGLWAYPGRALVVLLGLLAHGAAIEGAQWASGWRYGDWQDWLADALGVAVAWGVWRLWRR